MRYIDAFNHFFPQALWDKMMNSEGAAKDIGKRMRGIPCIYDINERLKCVDMFRKDHDYKQVISLGMPPLESLGTPTQVGRLASTAGVTRDRLVQRVSLEDRVFDLVDTGGMGFDDPDGLTTQIDAQITSGLATAALIVFVVEVRSGLLPADREVARRVRATGAPVLLVANKADDAKYDLLAHDFDSLGFGPPLVVSVRQNRNRAELVEEIVAHLPEAWPEEAEGAALPEMKLAIVGRRNVGKSTFTNALAHEDRVITSPVAGTTRDSVDVRFEVDGHSFLAIDTPGLRWL